MKKKFIFLIICMFTCLFGVGIFWGINAFSTQNKISRIGIGGGGAFFNPIIDPTNENIYYVTSDMGAIYYSHNKLHCLL